MFQAPRTGDRSARRRARDMEWPLDADLEFHTSLPTLNGREWISYVARFKDGRVEWIRRRKEALKVATPEP